MTLIWTLQFDGGESIDHYQVTPTPPCSRRIESSNQYQCNGLRVGQEYNFTVRAVNCENQEGPDGAITVTPQGEIIV